MEILAIIPARGGSKGIPQKNIKYVAGKPLIAWNILAAKQSKYITRILVSTDDAAIAAVSREYGADVLWRPVEISGDTATSESALLHAVQTLKDNEGYEPELMVFLQCTSPLTATEDIDTCIEKLIDNNADSATTVSDFHYFLWKMTSDGTGDGINHDKRFRPRRQDREQQFIETGAVYVMRTRGFLENKHRFFGKIVLSEMPAERVHEIDEPVDLLVAEVRLRQLIKQRQQDFLPSTIRAVIFDFDGVMTDDKVYVSQTGEESVRCGRDDGMGIGLLKRTNIQIAVLSTETNPVVSARCNKLGIECLQGLGMSKFSALEKWCSEKNITLSDVLFIGNDSNDIECMKNVACAITPANAHPSVLPYAKIVLQHDGGEGAVRELCDMIINRINKK